MTVSSTSPLNKRRALYRHLMMAILAAITVLAIASQVFDLQLHTLAAILLVAALIISLLQFRALDEVAKQAHYVAWLWGGMAVMGLVGVALAVLYAWPGSITIPVEAPLIRLFGDASPDTAFLIGFISSPLLMAVGFSIWWAVYWLRRR